MKNVFLNIGGFIHSILGIYHILISNAMISEKNVKEFYLHSIQMLNINTIIFMIFFAYITFFQKKELQTTRPGKAILLLMTLFYAFRGIEELIFFKFSLIVFVPCIMATLLFGYLFMSSFSNSIGQSEVQS
jgi:hypothetical protein